MVDGLAADSSQGAWWQLWYGSHYCGNQGSEIVDPIAFRDEDKDGQG
jgi:hypothetical protein